MGEKSARILQGNGCLLFFGNYCNGMVLLMRYCTGPNDFEAVHHVSPDANEFSSYPVMQAYWETVHLNIHWLRQQTWTSVCQIEFNDIWCHRHSSQPAYDADPPFVKMSWKGSWKKKKMSPITSWALNVWGPPPPLSCFKVKWQMIQRVTEHFKLPFYILLPTTPLAVSCFKQGFQRNCWWLIKGNETLPLFGGEIHILKMYSLFLLLLLNTSLREIGTMTFSGIC